VKQWVNEDRNKNSEKKRGTAVIVGTALITKKEMTFVFNLFVEQVNAKFRSAAQNLTFLSQHTGEKF